MQNTKTLSELFDELQELPNGRKHTAYCPTCRTLKRYLQIYGKAHICKPLALFELIRGHLLRQITLCADESP